MRKKLLQNLKALKGCTSGNAMMLMALGMPMLIGGAGLGVDFSQWYLWKRELQLATDQAAIAAAWAKTATNTSSSYQTRGTQDYYANLEPAGQHHAPVGIVQRAWQQRAGVAPSRDLQRWPRHQLHHRAAVWDICDQRWQP